MHKKPSCLRDRPHRNVPFAGRTQLRDPASAGNPRAQRALDLNGSHQPSMVGPALVGYIPGRARVPADVRVVPAPAAKAEGPVSHVEPPLEIGEAVGHLIVQFDP